MEAHHAPPHDDPDFRAPRTCFRKPVPETRFGRGRFNCVSFLIIQ